MRDPYIVHPLAYVKAMQIWDFNTVVIGLVV